MKLGLGTVQFGLDYGITNKAGRTPVPEVERILALAADNGIEVLDTAALYGDSETVLGQVLPPRHDFRIITKTPSFKAAFFTAAEAGEIKNTLHCSLERLRQDRVYGLLVHHVDDLLAPGGMRLVEEMRYFTEQGLVRKIGVSVYSGQQIDRVLDLFTPDIVQLPLNLFDQRLLDSGHLAKLKSRGVEIHARSVFLQGLLLMEPDAVPPHFSPIRDIIQHYADFLKTNKLSRLQAALTFGIRPREVDTVLVGVSSAAELHEVLDAADIASGVDLDMSEFKVSDERMINPLLWKL